MQPRFSTIFLFLIFFSTFLPAQTDTLRLIFAGDIMGHTSQIEGARTSAGTYDYRPAFGPIRPVLETADLVIGNLELTLPGKPPYSGYPMFRSPDALAEALKDAGFDILVTANNHANDSRGPGVIHTIDVLRDLGFQQTGTFKNARDRDLFYPLMVYRNQFKLAFLNYTFGTNGIPTDPPTIVNLIDTVQMARDLADARARAPHFIIAVMHWGLECQTDESAGQRDLARFLIRKGADMVIGSHPHVVQPIRTETVTLPDGSTKSAIVVYSLGNFIADQQTPGTDGGILFQADLLRRENEPFATVGTYGYIPVWRYVEKQANGKGVVYTLPANLPTGTGPELSPAVAAAMAKFVEGVRKRLNGCCSSGGF